MRIRDISKLLAKLNIEVAKLLAESQKQEKRSDMLILELFDEQAQHMAAEERIRNLEEIITALSSNSLTSLQQSDIEDIKHANK